MAKETVFNLSAVVVKSWDQYSPTRMASVWQTLYALYRGTAETVGGSSY